MAQVMGEFPQPSRRVPADMRIVDERRDRGLLWRKITFAVEPGDRCWAWLLVPESRAQPSAAPGPAVLCLHQTTDIGKDEPAGLGGLDNLHYALELAQRGLVTIAPDYPNFGDYRVDPYALGYASATLKGIWNHMRAVDLLIELNLADPKRIGCIGHSLGGHNALFLAVFEARIRAVVSSCGFTLFRTNRAGGDGPLEDVSDWSHAGYMPRIAERYGCNARNLPFEWTDVLTAIAPRPIFINAPEHDMFLVDGVRECVRLVAPEFARLGAGADALVCRHPDCAHDFPPDVRQEAYAFLERRLS